MAAPAPSIADVGRMIRSIGAVTRIQANPGLVYYRAGETNHCPGCCGRQWHVGRTSAECARCGHALLLFHPAASCGHPEGD